MPEQNEYLGIMAADRPVTVPTAAASRLIRSMRRSNLLEISGVHKAPALVRSIAEDHRIVHPVLGASGERYAGLPYTFRHLAMTAQRIPRGRIWNRGQSEGHKDELHIILGMEAEGTPDGIGTLARRPDNLSIQEDAKVRSALNESMGYAALRAVLSTTQENATRKMTLFGENTTGESEELPFTSEAASIFIAQIDHALQKDLVKYQYFE